MRLIGIFVCGFSIALYGFLITARLILRSKQQREIITLIQNVSNQMQYQKNTIMSILKDNMKKLSLAIDMNDCNPNEYFKKICYENDKLLLSEEEKNTLYSFLINLGNSDLESQIRYCASYEEIFKEYYQKSNEQNKNKIKIYPSIFILLGLLVIVILF